MSSRLRRLVATGTIALVCGQCSTKVPPPVAHATLEGAVARVGSVAIPPALVSEVAAVKGVSVHQAVDDLVGDALAAQGAQARGFDGDPRVSWERTAAWARRVPAHLADEAIEQGPPSDDELASVLVVHALVLRSSTLREEDALAIAGAIGRAVAGARTADEFVARAAAVSHPHAQVIAQEVGPFSADGVAPGDAALDAGFVAAAFALRVPFMTSPIVTTPFGWHVLQLVHRKVPDGPSDAAAKAIALGPAVQSLRGRMHLDALLRARRSAARVEVVVAADVLMARAMASP